VAECITLMQRPGLYAPISNKKHRGILGLALQGVYSLDSCVSPSIEMFSETTSKTQNNLSRNSLDIRSDIVMARKEN
jgi:hypothetical protein